MICVYNIVVVLVVVGMIGKEGFVICKMVWLFVYYVIFSGVIGYVIVWYVEWGWFNFGFVIVLLIVCVVVVLIVCEEFCCCVLVI